MIIRSAQPQAIEFPFSELRDQITPTERFYIRDHFPQPQLDRQAWRLKVEGSVSEPLELTFEDILSLPPRVVVSTLECAGNGRSFLTPPARGVQWDLGAVGTAEWTGVSLSTILQRAGMKPSARDVILEGADSGEINDDTGPHPNGKIHFARSLPVKKALDPDVLLAYRMNGEPLTVAHGYPLRAIVPGWYAVASVKWLSRIIVSDEKFKGYFETVDYGYWQTDGNGPVRMPITTLKVKSEIARPQMQERVRTDSDYEIFGACWSGETDVEKVEISTDDGKQWQPATLIGEPVRNAWRLWRFQWHTPSAAGKTVLRARATDTNGNAQPMDHDPDYGDYMINTCLPIEVELY